MRTGPWALATLLIVVASLWSNPSHAHEFRPGRLDVTAVAPGRYLVRFTPPTASVGNALTLRWPAWCVVTDPVVDCGTRDLLGGSLRIEGMGAQEDVVVRIDGGPVETVTVLSAAEPAMAFSAAAAGTWTHYLRRGVEHVLGGADHLLFVLGIVWVVGRGNSGRRRTRRLLVTVTAFTLAHSLTLALAVFGVVRLAGPPVETAIALSVLLLAVEAARGRPDTMTRRWPWAVAFGFGLVHGLGFAGALIDMGLPETGRALALVGFNLGVEAGQIGVVALLLLFARMFEGRVSDRRITSFPIYFAGTLAFWWTLERALTLGGPG